MRTIATRSEYTYKGSPNTSAVRYSFFLLPLLYPNTKNAVIRILLLDLQYDNSDSNKNLNRIHLWSKFHMRNSIPDGYHTISKRSKIYKEMKSIFHKTLLPLFDTPLCDKQRRIRYMDYYDLINYNKIDKHPLYSLDIGYAINFKLTFFNLIKMCIDHAVYNKKILFDNNNIFVNFTISTSGTHVSNYCYNYIELDALNI